ncbi:MAG: hypothetical protein ACTSR8_00720 [Promethearchaeota archaeon]
MLTKVELLELERISDLSPQECKDRLIKFIEDNRKIIERSAKLKNWEIRIVDKKEKRPWLYVQMYNEVYHRVKRQLEMVDCITLGKIHNSDFKEKRELIQKYSIEKNIEKLKQLLIPLS